MNYVKWRIYDGSEMTGEIIEETDKLLTVVRADGIICFLEPSQAIRYMPVNIHQVLMLFEKGL